MTTYDPALDHDPLFVRQGEHLAWRLHQRRMLSGAALECRASGVPLCEAPAKDQPGLDTPECPCGASGGAT